jgi:replicative DNA helicase
MSDMTRQSKADPVERFRKDMEAALKRLNDGGGVSTRAREEALDAFLDAWDDVRGVNEAKAPTVAAMHDLLRDEWASVTEGHGREYLGLKCGIRGIDNLLNGWDGLALLGAEPNIGKTVLLSQVGRGIVENDPSAAFVFFSFEMSPRSIMRREMVKRSGLKYRVLLQGSPDLALVKRTEAERLAHEGWNKRDRENALHARKEMLEDQDGAYQRTFIVGPEAVRHMSIGHRDPLGPMRDIVHRAMESSKCERVFVGIDYLQRIPVDQSAARSDLDRDERTMEAVHAFQRRLGHPVLAIAEFRKDDFAPSTEDDTGKKKSGARRPSPLAQFAGSRRLSYSADALISLESKSEPRTLKTVNGYSDEVREVDLHVVKGRDGMERGTVPLYFHIFGSRFTERPKESK